MKVRLVHLQLGFAEGVTVDNGWLSLRKPFRRLHIPGTMDCRGPWEYNERLPVQDYGAEPYPPQMWMLLDVSDLAAVRDLTAECHVDLPMDGFNRTQIL